VGDHLKADLGRIEGSARELRHLYGEFSRLHSTVDGYEDAFGSPDVAAKMDEFASKWKIHRQRIVNSLDVVAKAAQAGVDAYTGVDDDLTKALRAAMSGPAS
jgi:hypothetical protein